MCRGTGIRGGAGMPEKPKTNRALQAERMRESIQNIVEDMARSQALDDIRIQDICARAGISMGNFYQYFSCKEEAMIYSYQHIDREWQKERFEDIPDGLARAFRIVECHLETFAKGTMCFATQLYISQLKVYDSYFFTKDRYLHQALSDAISLAQQSGQMKTDYSPKELAIKILNFSRGLVYNYCIRHEEDQRQWLAFAKHEQHEYFRLFTIDKK